MSQFNFEAIGTHWQIDIYEEISASKEAEISSLIAARIERFDKAYSRFRADSLVTEMSKTAGTYQLPSDAEKMISLYHDLYIRTEGLVTPLVGNLISDAGYDATYTLKQKSDLVVPPSWEETMEYGDGTVVMKKPALLDFGAAGKGYLIDIVGEVLENQGVKEYCVDAGGDILYKNKEAIRIGLENPNNTAEAIGVCTLKEGSICGSAGNRRAWGTFNHIMNPKTLSSANDISAVWVVASSALIADALATCLFFVKPEKLSGYDFEYVLVRSDRTVEQSAHFPGELFLGSAV